MQQPAVPASYLLTFDGAVQNVLIALGIDVTAGGENSIAELHVEADPANGAAAEIGGIEVDTTGLYIAAPTGGVPAPPRIFAPRTNSQLFLSQLYVKGTIGQKLRLLVIPYNH